MKVFSKHAACGRWRAPGVMTTTLRANAQELQVSTTVKENARDALVMPQFGAAGPDRPRQQSLPCWRSFNPLFRRAGDRSRHHSAHRRGLELLSTGTGLYGAYRSTQCCLAVWSRWVESSTRLGRRT